MSRLQQFLPQIAQANAALSDELQRNPAAREKYDIERVSHNQAQVVQMELHCGVQQQQPPPSTATTPLPDIVLPGREHPSNYDSDDDNNNNSDDNDDDPNDNNANDNVPKRPLIEELN
jgi:hypothetical protein